MDKLKHEMQPPKILISSPAAPSPFITQLKKPLGAVGLRNSSYTYDETWKDKLTSYNGQNISYDASGNPTSYLGHNLTWTMGRQLTSYDAVPLHKIMRQKSRFQNGGGFLCVNIILFLPYDTKNVLPVYSFAKHDFI